MYQTCIHCLRPLGVNESIEALPVGRRLAFDAAKGRLWVICQACERWNLAPFEQRWEAIEQAERVYRATRVRVSTDHIGLARLPDDTELVRVGAPQRPEFAAWRYGDQFGRRRRRTIVMSSGAVLGVGAAVGGAVVAGAGIIAMLPLLQLLNAAAIVSRTHQTRRSFVLPDGGVFVPVGLPRLVKGGPDDWGVDVGYTVLRRPDDPKPLPGWFAPSWDGEGKNEMGRLQLYGADALPLLRWAMPRANRAGASRSTIAEGVRLIEDAGARTRIRCGRHSRCADGPLVRRSATPGLSMRFRRRHDSRSKWRYTKTVSGAPWRESSRHSSRHGGTRKRSRRLPTICWCLRL